MHYDGPCGDGSTLDTLKLKPVGTCITLCWPLAAPVLAAWREHAGIFKQILDATSPSVVLAHLQSMPGWRGTGFRATLSCLLCTMLDEPLEREPMALQ